MRLPHWKGDEIEVTLLTFQVSGAAILLSVLIGIPLGSVLALSQFPGRNVLVSIANFGMGLPPVVVGLWLTFSPWLKPGDSNPMTQYHSLILGSSADASAPTSPKAQPEPFLLQAEASCRSSSPNFIIYQKGEVAVKRKRSGFARCALYPQA